MKIIIYNISKYSKLKFKVFLKFQVNYIFTAVLSLKLCKLYFLCFAKNKKLFIITLIY